MILCGVALWQKHQQHANKTVLFYGFAETKETEINLDHPVEVNRLFVTPGQRVAKGTLLAEVTHSNFGLKLNDISHQIDELKAEDQIRATNSRSDIQRLQAQKMAKENEINARIRQLEVERDVNQALVKDLKTIDVSTEKMIDPTTTKINSLREELRVSVRPLEVEISRLTEELAVGNNPTRVQLDKLRKEQEYYNIEKSKLSIVAPSDGLIGNIYCKEKENISSFTTLISFYEKNPTMINGYVYENLILEVEVGDTLEAISHQHVEHRCKGIVTGLGSRIVEIPERLRKNPEYKTYGREVLIEIPASNHFLQKEKVMLNLSKPNTEGGFFNLFARINAPSSHIITEKE